MTFTVPNISLDVIQNDIQAGEYLGIALDLGRISQEQMEALKIKLEATKAKLEAEDFTNLTKDDVLGDLFYTTALSYYAELDAMDNVQAKTMGVVAVRLPSEAHFSHELSVYSIFGIPMSVSSGGLAMDVDRTMVMVKALDGDNDKKVQFILSSGSNGSALEHSVPEQMFSTPDNPAYGISAVKALQIANDQGIPIYTIDQTNIDTILPQLQVDGDVKTDILNAVNAGMVVTVPKMNITFYNWTGCGYIIIDPNTGATANMISGGLSGAIVQIYIGALMMFIGLVPLVATFALPVIALIGIVTVWFGAIIFIAGLAGYFTNLTSAESEYFKCMLPVLISGLFGVILSLYGGLYIKRLFLTVFDSVTTALSLDTVFKCIDILLGNENT